MPLIGRRDCLPKSLHRGCKLGDLSQMRQRESSQRFPTAIGELNMHKRMAARVAPTRDQTGSLRTIDKTDNAVVAQHQRLRQLADRRPPERTATPYREQQLMLCRGQTLLFGLFFAPVQEATQARAQLQELLVLLMTQIVDDEGQYIVSRYRITIGSQCEHITIGAEASHTSRPLSAADSPTLHIWFENDPLPTRQRFPREGCRNR
jgi:hypothetical protein